LTTNAQILHAEAVRDDEVVVDQGEPDSAPELGSVLRALGVPAEAIARALERGDPHGAIFEIVPARGAAERTVTAAEIAADGGMPVERLAELTQAFGFPLPAPDVPAFTPQEATALRELWQLRDIWPFELSVQLGRVYGRLLARIAHAGVQLWVSVVEPRLQVAAPEERVRTLAAASTFDGLLPVADALLVGVHRRWIERETVQMAARGAERDLSAGHLPGAIETTFRRSPIARATAPRSGSSTTSSPSSPGSTAPKRGSRSSSAME
jgi:hypothetical protein